MPAAAREKARMFCRPATCVMSGLAMLLSAMPALGHDDLHSGPSGPPGSVGGSSFSFRLSEPGSYQLPPIKGAAGGKVLDARGRAHELAELLRGRITVLAFIYTRCADICPLTTMRLQQLREMASKATGVDASFQIISMSFDPKHDTPDVLAEYAALWTSPEEPGPEWHFLTSASEMDLAPILTAYGQAVTRKPDPKDAGAPFFHILRVVLIDKAGMVRNIYSLDFLEPEIVLNDLRTLTMEERQNCKSSSGRSECE